MTWRVLLAVVAGLLFAWGSYRARALTLSGAVAAGFFAATLVVHGELAWITPGVVFFAASSALSFVGQAQKQSARELEEKGSTRDALQVLANGGAAWLILLVYMLRPSPSLLVAYLGAFAAAAADTWATELGLLAHSRPRLLTTLERVESGTSGAVSLTGAAAALSGAVVIWMSAWPWVPVALHGSAWHCVILAGFCASFVDSLLGATLQGRHSWIGNDTVNLAATTAGALLAWTCFRAGVFAS